MLHFQSLQIIPYGLFSTFALGEGFHSRDTLKEDFAATSAMDDRIRSKNCGWFCYFLAHKMGQTSVCHHRSCRVYKFFDREIFGILYLFLFSGFVLT